MRLIDECGPYRLIERDGTYIAERRDERGDYKQVFTTRDPLFFLEYFQWKRSEYPDDSEKKKAVCAPTQTAKRKNYIQDQCNTDSGKIQTEGVEKWK